MNQSLDEKLHSEAPVVVIEAAGGCGKTTSAAKFAREAAARLRSGKVLLVSHTHAACGEFERKCQGQKQQVDVETCDGLCLNIVSSYARPLGLPTPVDTWLDRSDGVSFADLSKKAGELFRRAPTIARAVAGYYPIIVLDEHQDASTSQHEVVRLLREIGNSKLRIFGDPMQAIHMGDAETYVDWDQLCASADDQACLEEPHRWKHARELGEWINACRSTLKAGNSISLKDLPQGVSVSIHSGLAGRNKFNDVGAASRVIHRFLDDAPSNSAVLSFLDQMATSIAQVGSWRASLNEGAQLDKLNALITAMEDHCGNAEKLAHAFLDFVGIVGVGFPESERAALRSRLGTTIRRQQAGERQLSWLSRLEPIYAAPNHRGIVTAMWAIRNAPPDRYTIRLRDHVWALCSFGRTDDPRAFRSTLGRIRRQRRWPPQTISTIHKAKGLEFDHVLLCPVDRHQYPETELGARLLYVGLSRACKSLKLVLAGDSCTSLVRM